MATNLVVPDADLAIIQACLVRVARLGPDCTPLTGTNAGFVNSGIMSFTTSPEIDEGTTIEPNNGCGGKLFTFRPKGLITRWTITGELGYFSVEQQELMFGGEVLEGIVGGDYAGKAIGYAYPDYTDPPYDGIYMEVISKVIDAEAGECVGGSGAPPYIGRVLGKVSLVPGDLNQQNDHVPVPFTGVAERNPNIGTGPWGDSPVQGGWTARPVQFAYYSQDEFDAIEALAGPGYVDI